MKSVFVVLFLLVHYSGACQVAIGYFPFNSSFIQLSSDPERLIFGDARLQTNTFKYNTTIELGPYINIKRSEAINLYIGPGISLSPFYNDGTNTVNFYFLSLGARIKPLPFNRDLAVLFELSPTFNSEPRNDMLRTNLGMSYNFRFKKRSGKKTNS